MTNKAIDRLVDENFVYAKVLNYLGVQFYENRGKTMNQVCEEYNVNLNLVNNLLETYDKEKPSADKLKKYPASLIIEYLRHAHQLFVKDRLPYILRLINAIDGDESTGMIGDLKFVMPIFVEDFIKHIHEEEDSLFYYISALEKALRAPKAPVNFQLSVDKFSIREFALHHGDSDDEMKGIRGITDQYRLEDITDLHLRVILQELQRFDEELSHHASIENEVLFPKALNLEEKLRSVLNAQTTLN